MECHPVAGVSFFTLAAELTPGRGHTPGTASGATLGPACHTPPSHAPLAAPLLCLTLSLLTPSSLVPSYFLPHS